MFFYSSYENVGRLKLTRRGEFHTHIHLHYVWVKFLYCIIKLKLKIKKKIHLTYLIIAWVWVIFKWVSLAGQMGLCWFCHPLVLCTICFLDWFDLFYLKIWHLFIYLFFFFVMWKCGLARTCLQPDWPDLFNPQPDHFPCLLGGEKHRIT